MRYTGIVSDTQLERAVFITFDTIDDGATELAAFMHDHPGSMPTMQVGEPGDEGPQWVVTTTPNGNQSWRLTNTSTTPAHNVEFTLA